MSTAATRGRFAEPPACCVCGDWQVPRRVVLWNRDTDPIAIAAICEESSFCQARAAGNKLDGLVARDA